MTDKNEKLDGQYSCPDCGNDAHASEVADKLSAEITQAINRAISKSDANCSVAVLAMPLAMNVALVLFKWEQNGGDNLDDALDSFVDAVRAYHKDVSAAPPEHHA